jgi:hypothetical protein
LRERATYFNGGNGWDLRRIAERTGDINLRTEVIGNRAIIRGRAMYFKDESGWELCGNKRTGDVL